MTSHSTVSAAAVHRSLFHVARWDSGGNAYGILTNKETELRWLSGFASMSMVAGSSSYKSLAGVALHEGQWLTTTVDRWGGAWQVRDA